MGAISGFFENFFDRLANFFGGYGNYGPGGLNPGYLLIIAIIALALMLYFFVQSQK